MDIKRSKSNFDSSSNGPIQPSRCVTFILQKEAPWSNPCFLVVTLLHGDAMALWSLKHSTGLVVNIHPFYAYVLPVINHKPIHSAMVKIPCIRDLEKKLVELEAARGTLVGVACTDCWCLGVDFNLERPCLYQEFFIVPPAKGIVPETDRNGAEATEIFFSTYVTSNLPFPPPVFGVSLSSDFS